MLKHLRFYTSRTHFGKSIPRSSGKMQTAFVYVNDSDNILKLSFPYTDHVINKNRLLFQRPSNEPLETTFSRILLKIGGLHDRKNKKRKKTHAESEQNVKSISLPMKLVHEELDICGTTLNCDAWKSNSLFTIGDSKYVIHVNPPTVLSIKLPTEIMAGFPVVPYAQLQHATIENSSFVWYKSEMCVEDRDRTGKDSKKENIDRTKIKWIPLVTGYMYNVKNDDVGHLLRVVCYPKLRDGEIECVHDEAVGKNPVGAGPDSCPYHIRQEFTKEKCDNKSFRVLSYNILANCYADSDYSRGHLFSHCPPYALSWDYRKQLLLDEIPVTFYACKKWMKRHFSMILNIFFKSQHLIGCFDLKGGEMHEGLACFYNQHKFKLLNKFVINLGEEAQKNENMSDICNKIKENEKLSERFFKRKTILQVLELEVLDDNRRLLVANTHLYFHPDADHIRLLQGSIIIKYIEELLALKKLENTDFQYSVVICGDFNSCPEFGVYQLMMSQHIPENSADWKSCQGEEVKNLSVSHALDLESAYGCPSYTNYTLLFNGCLDYIFFDQSNLKLLKNVVLPTHDEVTLYKAIPNIVFPSDHLCLISDLQWK
ncbi:2',5'-phosphodiesterase 12 [Nymphon striatum]|nr:2',5'-phosphodiesterase 12 [Nymphon striatum]